MTHAHVSGMPRSSHLIALLHTLCYVNHSIGQEILLRAYANIKLQAFIDSDWAACVDSIESITGFFYYLVHHPLLGNRRSGVPFHVRISGYDFCSS